jgi:hypothetical protein
MKIRKFVGQYDVKARIEYFQYEQSNRTEKEDISNNDGLDQGWATQSY